MIKKNVTFIKERTSQQTQNCLRSLQVPNRKLIIIYQYEDHVFLTLFLQK